MPGAGEAVQIGVFAGGFVRSRSADEGFVVDV
jgi:hypothetical protein